MNHNFTEDGGARGNWIMNMAPCLTLRGAGALTRELVLVLIAITLVSCQNHAPAPAPKTVAIARGALELTVGAPGKIEPKQKVTVKSKAAGAIKEVLVEEGDTVAAGDLLLTLDPEVEKSRLAEARAEFAAASAAVHQAEVALASERDNHRRSKALFSDGLISRASYDQARRAKSHARDSLEIARSRESAKSHLLKESEDRLSYTEIRAPMAGVVLDLEVSPGQVVSSGATGLDAGTPLLVMADLSRLLVGVEVEETDVAAVKVGQEVRIEVDAYPDEVFPGEVERVSPEATERGAVTVVEVEIGVIDVKGATLRPGMSASVEVITHRSDDALLAPTSGVLDRGGMGAVVLKDGGTEWRELELGPGDWDWVVIEDGLTVGEVVVLPKGPVGP